ncbi:type VI secretion system tip protein VgrG [Pseudomonas sp. B21-053]|uniref:type VI secretion system Vgr family protein n=1 Tax=Pseudomonas sp. B21-053 TaxID=2895493 RepID=UPI00222FC2AF|nr:type VI secretion system tip protein TssI/VgrG [Pseudomonas sp. B21-053]UZE13506.1 type VI secretion system tip protein VgrG [Pseudomonas sp. B21-053]
MFAPANQTHFALTIDGADSQFQVLSFTGREALNQPFEFELELVSEKASLNLESLLHKLAFLQLTQNGSGIHGLVYSIAQGEAGKRLTRYKISLRPQLAYLAHRVNQRIFQQMTVPQIIAQVLEEHGILASEHKFQLSAVYPERIYCVQYDESDLHFVQRLCEEEGIHYHFQHSASGHLLVFGDDQTVFPKLAPVTYQQDTGLVADQPVIKRFGLRMITRTSRTTRRDYDFTKPKIELESDAKSAAKPDLEDYDYPGRFVDRERGKHLANRALERHRSDYRLAEGSSDQPLLVTGHFLALAAHANPAWNDLWLLTEIFHEGKQPQVLEEVISSDVTDHKDDFHQGYRNRFSATPWDVPYRPPLDHPKPKVLGTQSAVVTGPEGEEIFCDQYGRVKVQFFWDREGQHDDKTSCWMRVATNWAAQTFGSINLPRVGMEVLISFLEGDPDQPLITGCLYHGANLPPYKLPDFKTLATVKSKEYKGSRANELRIDDTTSEISIALRSDHGASAINLGYLTHPRPSGGQPRGEGFELRTDRHGAVRAAAGLLITTEPRPNESKHHKDLPETAERLATASEQQDGFALQAKELQAQEPGDQDDVAKALHAQHQGILGSGPANMSANEFPEFTEAHLVLASPAGIALSTPRSSHIATGEHLALSSTGHTSLSIGKRLLASASQGMRLFVQNLGWRLVAASGDIDIRALKDSINLLAKLNITANADRITITAKTELVIQGGGSATTYNAGGITHATTGPYTAHAANFAYTGAKSLAGVFPEPPKPGKGNLELFNQYAGLQGIKGGDFEVVDALGKSLKGTLDAKGFATVSGAAPGPARVMFGKDPADTWSDGSYIGKAQWPLSPPSAEDIPGPVQAMVAQVLPSKNWDVLEKGKALAQTGMSAVQTAQGAMQTAQQVKSAVQGGVAGLPKLASAAMPSASSLLGAASRSGKLPSLPAVTPPKTSFKTPGLLAGEMLS